MYTEVIIGFIDQPLNVPYFAREDEGALIFTVGVISGSLDTDDIEFYFSTADGLVAGD